MRPSELDLTYTLETLECFATEDDDSGGLFGGDGDEPYLWAVGFKVDATTLGPPPPGNPLVPSLNVQIIQGAPFFKHVVGAGHVKHGQKVQISPLLGTRSFRVSPTRLPVAGWFPGVAGVICLLWDEDAFSPSTSEAGFKKFVEVLGPELSTQFNALMAGTFDAELAKDANGVTIPNAASFANLSGRLARLRDPAGRKNGVDALIKQAKENIKSKVTDALVDAAGLDELLDPDDLLGAEAQVNLGDELDGTLPFSLDFSDDEAHYRIRGRCFGKPAHRVELGTVPREDSRNFDRLVALQPTICGKQGYYIGQVYRVGSAVRCELNAIQGPPPSQVRWFIDDKPIAAGTSTVTVNYSPPGLQGFGPAGSLATDFPPGPGTLTCVASGTTLDIRANGSGVFAGMVRALWGFPGDPPLVPAAPPANPLEDLALGYDTSADIELATLDLVMGPDFDADLSECIRKRLRRFTVKYVPAWTGTFLEPPEHPDWREQIRTARRAAQDLLALTQVVHFTPGAMTVLSRQPPAPSAPQADCGCSPDLTLSER